MTAGESLDRLWQSGFAIACPEGPRRIYAIDPQGPREARNWLERFSQLDALATEVDRGKRKRREGN